MNQLHSWAGGTSHSENGWHPVFITRCNGPIVIIPFMDLILKFILSQCLYPLLSYSTSGSYFGKEAKEYSFLCRGVILSVLREGILSLYLLFPFFRLRAYDIFQVVTNTYFFVLGNLGFVVIQASERRCEELITQVPDSTRPLLRQIEAMQVHPSYWFDYVWMHFCGLYFNGAYFCQMFLLFNNLMFS